MSKPTIAELEAILQENGVEIDIRPNGEVYIKSEFQDAIQRAEQAEAREAKLRAVLEAVEYYGTYGDNQCPWCDAVADYNHNVQHKPDCARQDALQTAPDASDADGANDD